MHSYSFRSLRAWRTIDGLGNPRPNEIAVELSPDHIVTGDTLMLFSPSQKESFKRCERKWGLYAIDKKEKKTTKAQELGIKLHGQLESWLAKGIPPESNRLTSSPALGYFPLPSTLGLKTEQVFVIEVMRSDGDKLYFWGFKDVEVIVPNVCGGVWDLKTTKSFDWQKTRKELIEDTQANVYALDTLLKCNLKMIPLQWVYVRTTGAPDAKVTDWDFDIDRVLVKAGELAEQAFVMKEIKIRGRAALAGVNPPEIFSLSIPGNRNACNDFGGCEYRHFCTDLKAGSMLASIKAQRKLAQTRHDARLGKTQESTGTGKIMGIMDKLNRAVKTTPTVAVGTGQRVETQEKTSALASAFNKNTPSNVVPPDAKPPPLKPSEVKPELAPQSALVEAPETRSSAEPVETPAEVQKRKRGRPAKNSQNTPANTEFVLLLDVLSVKGDSQDIDVLIAPSRAAVEQEAGKPYKLIEYNQGGAFLAAQLDIDLVNVSGVYHAVSRTLDADVLRVLMSKADTIFTAVGR